MAIRGFENAHEVAAELDEVFGLEPGTAESRLTERNWGRIAVLFARWWDLIEQASGYFARAHEIRKNPEWAPNRPIRAELKLARLNEKIDAAEDAIFDALELPRRAHPENPLAPRSLAYFVPIFEDEADRLEAEANAR